MNSDLGSPIPVLLTVRALHHGGNERDVCNLATHIDCSRFEPHVATLDASGMRYLELCAAGIPILELPKASMRAPHRTLSAALLLQDYLRTWRIQVVHAFDTTAALAVPVARSVHVPVVVASYLTPRHLLSRRLQLYLRLTHRLVDKTVVNCGQMRRQLIDDKHVPDERIQLCHNGVDTTEFNPQGRSSLDAIRDSLVIGAVCVQRAEKALDILLESFARVLHFNPEMRLMLVGDGPERARLQQICVRLNLQEHCTFLPSTAAVAPLMRSMDIFVLCSYSECLPNALLEAMACGCSVVASSVGGVPEVIGRNERGLLFSAGDVEGLTAQLTRLILDERLRRGLASSAAAYVREQFNVGKTTDAMANLYEKLIAQS